MAKVLCVTYGTGHVNMTLPVVEELHRDARWEVAVVGLTTARERLRRAGVPFKGFAHYVEPSDSDALEWGKRLAEEMHSEGKCIPWEESVAYLGLSMLELVQRVGQDKAQREVSRVGRWAFHPVRTMERIVQFETPDVVLTTNSPRAEFAALEVAKAKGIPNVMMVDLFGTFRPDKMIADYVCVSSTIARDNLVRLGGIDPRAIRVTGNPAFDRLATVDTKKQRQEARRRFSIPNSDRCVLLALQPIPEAMPMLQAMKQWAARGSDRHLLVRPHPNQEPGPFEAAISDVAQAHIAAAGTVKLESAVCGADLVVTATSTVGIEATLLAKPLVTVDLGPKRMAPAPHADVGLAVAALSPKLLPDTVDSVMGQESLIAQLTARAAEVFPRTGTSAKAVASVIEEAVSNRR